MKANKKTIFLVDDNPVFLKTWEEQFKENENNNVQGFTSGEACLEKLHQNPDVVFLDYYLNSENPKAMNGLRVLENIKVKAPTTEVVMLSSQDRLEVAVNCIKHGAFDYIVKSEAAFMRAQKAIATIFDKKKLKKETRYYKTLAIVAVVMVVVIISLSIVLNK
jgi:DNA-binding NtrC family response regulator